MVSPWGIKDEMSIDVGVPSLLAYPMRRVKIRHMASMIPGIVAGFNRFRQVAFTTQAALITMEQFKYYMDSFYNETYGYNKQKVEAFKKVIIL
jgi:hypothetical protein